MVSITQCLGSAFKPGSRTKTSSHSFTALGELRLKFSDKFDR